MSSTKASKKHRSKKSKEKKAAADESSSESAGEAKEVVTTTSTHLPLANDDDEATVASDRPLVTPRPHAEAAAVAALALPETSEALDFGRFHDELAALLSSSSGLETAPAQFAERDGARTSRLFALAMHGSTHEADAAGVRARRSALALLAQLAAHQPNVEVLVRRGMLTIFLRLLQHSSDAAELRTGVVGLANLAASAEVKREILEIGALPLVLKALYAPDDRDTLFAGLRALRRLAELPANRDALAAAGAVTHVCGQVAVLASDHSLVYEAMGFMSNLARSNTARKALCAEKAAHVLVVLLARHTDSAKLATRALEALFRIAADADGQRMCGAANAIDTVLTALDRVSVPEAKLTAISLLHRLLREPTNGDAFAAANGLARLWPWLESYWKVPRLVPEARDILALISRISPAQAAAVQLLEKSLESSSTTGTAASTATASTADTAAGSTAAPRAATATTPTAAAPSHASEAAAKEIAAAVMSPSSPLFARRKSGRSQDLLASLAAEADRLAAQNGGGGGARPATSKAPLYTSVIASKTLPSSFVGARTSAFAGLSKPKNTTRTLLKQLEDEVKAELSDTK